MGDRWGCHGGSTLPKWRQVFDGGEKGGSQGAKLQRRCRASPCKVSLKSSSHAVLAGPKMYVSVSHNVEQFIYQPFDSNITLCEKKVVLI